MPVKVLIVGSGIVGLVLAQGCKKYGIPYQLFERDPMVDSRHQGYGMTLWWSTEWLQAMLPESIWKRIPDTYTDPNLDPRSIQFKIVDGATGDTKNISMPSQKRLPVDRNKFRRLIAEGIDIEFNKKLIGYKVYDNGVTLSFENGTTAEGDLLVGVDGSNSTVRRLLVGEQQSQLYKLPITLTAMNKRLTRKQVAPFREIDPWFFMVNNSQSGEFIWFAIQNAHSSDQNPGHEDEIEVNIIPAWRTTGSEAEETIEGRLALARAMAKNFREPFKSLLEGVGDQCERVAPIQFADWVPIEWDGQSRVTLAGDSAHPMTMFRGEGGNHGIVDAFFLVHHLLKVKQGEVPLNEALRNYECELRSRTSAAVLASRHAAMDATDTKEIPADSPLLIRKPPKFLKMRPQDLVKL